MLCTYISYTYEHVSIQLHPSNDINSTRTTQRHDFCFVNVLDESRVIINNMCIHIICVLYMCLFNFIISSNDMNSTRMAQRLISFLINLLVVTHFIFCKCGMYSGSSIVYIHIVNIQCQHVSTGWRRLIGSPKLQIIFHKRATKYRALLRKMTYKDKGSCESSPPCIQLLSFNNIYSTHTVNNLFFLILLCVLCTQGHLGQTFL